MINYISFVQRELSNYLRTMNRYLSKTNSFFFFFGDKLKPIVQRMNRYTRNNTKEEFNSCRNFLCPPRFTIRDISTSRGTYARLAISISRYKCKYLSVNPSQLAVSAFYLLSFFSLSSFFDTKFEILFFLIHGTNDYARKI